MKGQQFMPLRQMRCAGMLTFFISALSTTNPVYADSKDSILSRLDIIEQRLEASGPSAAAPASNAAYYEVNIAKLREELRQLRGEIEALNYRQGKLKEAMRRMEQDVELRLEAIEKVSAAPLVPTLNDAADSSSSAPLKNAPDTAKPLARATSANEAYQQAFETLNKKDYANAEKQFAAFIAAHPDHALIGNAYYWLGETHYVQNQHEVAAQQFRQGFQVLPEGPKAPDNLLRLGMTLSVLERRKEACIIFKQLLNKYQGRSDSVRRKATRESEQLGCS